MFQIVVSDLYIATGLVALLLLIVALTGKAPANLFYIVPANPDRRAIQKTANLISVETVRVRGYNNNGKDEWRELSPKHNGRYAFETGRPYTELEVKVKATLEHLPRDYELWLLSYREDGAVTPAGRPQPLQRLGEVIFRSRFGKIWQSYGRPLNLQISIVRGPALEALKNCWKTESCYGSGLFHLSDVHPLRRIEFKVN
jgi:hypothetical protein